MGRIRPSQKHYGRGSIEEFLQKNIITPYSIPKILVSDNLPQFDAKVIKEMCTKLGIEHRFAPVCFPKYNGQVEVMNRIIFVGIKKDPMKTGCQWYNELDRVLWSYRSTTSNSMGETPFSLVYGTKAVLPIEVCLPNIRQIGYNEEIHDERMRENLNFVDELRDRALGKPIDHTWHGVYLKKYYA
ncbi:hypothetical protein LIER_29254 [Lithospermum erythrorhizon]|uniref:Integrase catalytic domain-containing protein n=1 Tax=Lithospermum erythrorhizon TaxID=34254 RepID=A0AAV3RLJ9_LITER